MNITPDRCPECGDLPGMWGSLEARRPFGIPLDPYLYRLCECGMAGPTRRLPIAATRAWNEMVRADGQEEA